MGKATSIAISAKDNFSPAVTSMRAANQAFRKDLEDTKRRLDELNNKKYSLKVDADIAKNNLNEARKAFKGAQEGTEDYQKALERLQEAHFDQDTISKELSDVSAAARQAEKDILSLSDVNKKLDNRAGGPIGAGTEKGGVLSTLAGAGAAKMVGDLLSNAAGTFVGSAYGREGGMYFDSVLSSGAMGAAIGTTIAPGIGTAVGAALGAVAGLIEGARKVFESKDDYFKDYYQTLYNSVTSAQQQSLGAGIPIAGTREMDLLRMGTLLRGNTAAAGELLQEFIELSRTPPLSYDDILQLSTGMLSLGHSTQTVKERLVSLSEAGAALNMSGSSVTNLAGMLDSAIEMGTFDSRLIRTLTKQGIDVSRAISESFRSELTGEMLREEDVLKVIENLNVDEVVDAIYKFMAREFEGSVEKAAESYIGLSGILDSYKADVDAAQGEGYTGQRKSGLRDQIDWLSGESGEKMKEAYTQIGQWQASLENLREQMERDAMTAVMSGVVPDSLKDAGSKEKLNALALEYAELSKAGTEEAGAQMGALLAEAQAIAANEYHASEGYQLQLSTQLSLAENIKNDAGLKSEYYDAGRLMGEQFSLGLASAVAANAPSILSPQSPNMPTYAAAYNPANAPSKGSNIPSYAASSGKAYGLDRVPYNNYQVLLHEGERVLTASEARSQDAGAGAPQVSVTVNGLTVREDADIDRIARELASRIKQAHILSA